ncbi:hypothetical protein BU26DRAFT_517756 [Trematosphaeria pertusa]|uniref:Uncharacterized protein n=1 Tax=Trematosphaeria pertusa TaxID=390896 RepID=A0A6A6ILC4_9PLEO|nr:uncharacterized protein BU26DRAFT_517756 [Trematosphaeria pertusa]KAF2251007.1 hypothetical protein BU26DRAFT_517756 [Trematosphaeria pertusa]
MTLPRARPLDKPREAAETYTFRYAVSPLVHAGLGCVRLGLGWRRLVGSRAHFPD